MRKLISPLLLGIAVLCFSGTLHAETYTIDFEDYLVHLGGTGNSWSVNFPGDVGEKSGATGPYGDPEVRTAFTVRHLTLYNYAGSSWGMDYWRGMGLSTMTNTSNTTYLNDMTSVTGTANSGSVYGIICGDGTRNLAYNDSLLPVIMFQPGVEIVSMAISTTVYSDFVMRYGDGFAEPGGWMNLLIYGINAEGQLVDTFTQPLAWYEGNTYRTLNHWETISFEGYFADVVELRFAFDSNEYSSWGLNYPAYFAFDDIVYRYNDGTSAVPEPATLAVFGLGLFGLGFARSRRRK